MVARKDFTMNKHQDVDVPNLYVIKLMTSMKSRGYVKEQFSWMWFYWYLTNEGIEFLRDDLGLPPEIVPATLKKPRAQATRPFSTGRDRSQSGSRGAERSPSTRRGASPAEGGEKKAETAGTGFAPSFRREGGGGDRGGVSDRRAGGFGRGTGGFSRPFGGGGDRGDRGGYRRESPFGRGMGRGGGGGGAGAGTGGRGRDESS